MKSVNDVMTSGIRIARPEQTIRDAAVAMAEYDIGCLPVGEGDRLIGMITDRDIVLRAIAQGLGPDTPIRDVMSRGVKYCFKEEDVEDVAKNMAELQVRRLPVVDRDKRLVGIVTLSNITYNARASEFLDSVARPH